VVTDAPPVTHVPHFGLDDAAGVADFIERTVLRKV
jgi:hypothetical protein